MIRYTSQLNGQWDIERQPDPMAGYFYFPKP